MRILYLITKSETGGAQTHVFQMSQYMISKGHQVALMSYPGGWLEKEIKKMGASFYPNPFLSNDINLIKDLRAMRVIKKAVKVFRPVLVSCHSTKAGFLARLAIRNRIPTLFTAHGWGFTQGTAHLRKFVIPLEKIASLFCKKIICVSKNDRNLALRYKIAPEKKIIVIHNGVEIDYSFKVLPDKFKQEKTRIVFVGRFAPPKDQLLFLKAFLSLPKETREIAEVIFMGDGPERKRIESFIRENKLSGLVKLLGDVPRDRVFEVLKESHMFVLITNWEGFPRTILEAMSFGLPIIASDVGGIREAVDKRNGVLIERGNRKDIRDTLEKLIKNPLLAFEMGKASRMRAEEEFSLDVMLEKTFEVYQSILESKK